MTLDQCHSTLRVSIPDNYGSVGYPETPDGRDQGGHFSKLRRSLREMPALTMHLASKSRSSASCVEQLSMSAQGDIARLNQILRTQGCRAVMRAADGSAGDSAPSNPSAPAAMIFDVEGHPLASIEIIRIETTGAECSDVLLGALLEPVARAITERWFRLVHRRHMVVAAMQSRAPDSAILVALDRHQRVVGADLSAHRLLARRGLRWGPNLAITALFHVSDTLLRRRSSGDVATTCIAPDGEPWTALITPPEAAGMESYQDARVLLHVRPRLDALTHLSELPVGGGKAKRGLSQGALRRIEEYVETHLDSCLDVDELASIVRMSSSHFTRSFHKSVGVTPHRYVIQNRVLRARELLATTNMPLIEIALNTGFADQSHLSRRFQEVVGIPPGAFRGQDRASAP